MSRNVYRINKAFDAQQRRNRLAKAAATRRADRDTAAKLRTKRGM